MPWGQETVVRFWCPLGEECGKQNRLFNDAANREAAEQHIAQHLRSFPTHRDIGWDEGNIAEFVSNAHYCRFKKEVYFKSPPRSMKGDSGSDASRRGRGREHTHRKDRVVRSRSRSRIIRQKDMEYMSFQLQAIRQHGHWQATSTTKHKHSASGSLPSVMLDESAGSSIVSSSSIVRVRVQDRRRPSEFKNK
jgi:hypothetical protein